MGNNNTPYPFALGVMESDREALEKAKRDVIKISKNNRTYTIKVQNGYMVTTNPERYAPQK